MADLRFWGKERGLGGARYPVACHGLDAAAMLRCLWREYVSPGLRARIAELLELSEDETRRLLEFWAAAHDIGKITSSFQSQVEVPSGYDSDDVTAPHDEATQHALYPLLIELGYPGRIAKWAAQLLGGHHGRFVELNRECRSQVKARALGLGDEEWARQRADTLRVWRAVLEPPVPSSFDTAAANVVTGLVILADWLASRIPYVLKRLPDVPERGDVSSLSSFFHGSLAETPAVVAEAGLSPLRLRSGSFAEEFPDFPANELQRDIAERLPSSLGPGGLLMISAPTGFGKTETALHAARRMSEVTGTSGLFFALPTMATTEHMFKRIARYVTTRGSEPNSQAMLHGMAWLSPVEEMLREEMSRASVSGADSTLVHCAEWLLGAKRGLLAGAGVGTIDQALLSVLPTRHNALRMFALTGRTVVIDEVHAFDEYMRTLLCVLLRWLGYWNVPVVLLSATLPAPLATQLAAAYRGDRAGTEERITVPYPGWVHIGHGEPVVPRPVPFPDEQRRRLAVSSRAVEIRDGEPDRMPVLRRALTPLVEDRGTALVLCSTVAHAQRTWRLLREHLEGTGVELRLLHARFPMHVRESVTEELTARFGKPTEEDPKAGRVRERTILVATQVVEQSLDVDFDLVITDLAPVELLLQRAGRSQRHPALNPLRPEWADPNRGGTRELVVLTSWNDKGPPGAWAAVYPTASLVRAHRLLDEHAESGIRVPEDVQRLVDRGNPAAGDKGDLELIRGFEEAETRRQADEMIKRSEGKRVGIPRPRGFKALNELSDGLLPEERASTRFQADSERGLAYFVGADGVPRLDGPEGPALPRPSDGKLSREELISVMRRSVPMPRGPLSSMPPDRLPRLPRLWRDIWPLGELVALEHPVSEHGKAAPARVGERMLWLDDDVGLEEVAE
ncbi:CRISPR-associated endonuclease/helicase Cas3 [Actinopolyspora lacussalsi]|nr:CRISPR-associated endonuclease/helicase Cas3 [Actinopolyspora lacussalsi]